MMKQKIVNIFILFVFLIIVGWSQPLFAQNKKVNIITEPSHIRSFVFSNWLQIYNTDDMNKLKELNQNLYGDGVPKYITYQITANNGTLVNNISAHLSSLNKIRKNAFRFKQKEIRKHVADAVAVYGYYNPTIKIELRDITDIRDNVVLINVDRGDPVKIKKIDIEYNVETELLENLSKIQVKDHIVRDYKFSHKNYEKFKSDILTEVLARGYLKPEIVVSKVKINPTTNEANIKFVLNGNKRYKVGDLNYVGFEESHNMAKKLTKLKKGDYYESAKISELNQDLYETGYFRSVEVTMADSKKEFDENSDEYIPLNVSLTKNPYTMAEAGLGFSTDEKFRLMLSESNHWLNDSGHNFSSRLKLSKTNIYVLGDYVIPREHPKDDFYKISPQYYYKDDSSIDSKYRTIVLRTSYVTKLKGKWEREYFLEYGYDDFKQGSDVGNTNLLMPGITLSRVYMQNSLDPSWGYRVRVTLKSSLEDFISSSRILHGDVLLKSVFSPTENSRVLLRFEQGFISSHGFKDVPPRLRFFAGGDQSIRGFAYESISPKDGNGLLTGGKYLTVGSAELQIPIAESMRLATFFDIGDVVNSYQDQDWKYSTGLGFRYISPVGPIRVDIGAGISETHMPIRLHIGIGPEL